MKYKVNREIRLRHDAFTEIRVPRDQLAAGEGELGGFRKRANGAIGWGEKYFNGNFERFAKVKKMVDQDHFFGDMQSIPPIS
ncbi:hypothetical protein SASPL_157568 [Salvia splendens]|uniref:Berberine/berberine-like domain-containing protein n=1 Tax=Salvia splendens TaxID=180675 RepID=A0A8X8YW66_SALSN|nr:hypothetical protein SASPL_157568 [Salvia splendens]